MLNPQRTQIKTVTKLELPKPVRWTLSILNDIGAIITFFWGLAWVGVISEPPQFHGVISLPAYFAVFIFLLFGVFSAVIGYQIRSWRYPSLRGNVIAHLFFPENVPKEYRTLDGNPTRAVIVNTKTDPDSAWLLARDTEAWKLVEKYGASMWVAETDTAPDDPNFPEKWCEAREIKLLQHKVPTIEALAGKGKLGLLVSRDPNYDHVRYRTWYPFRYRSIPHEWRLPHIPPERILYNRSTRMAFPMEIDRWNWATSGAIRGLQLVKRPWPLYDYGKKWAEKNGYSWDPDPPSEEDLLAKKG